MAFFLFGVSTANFKWHSIASLETPKNPVFCTGNIKNINKTDKATKFIIKINECKESIDNNSQKIIKNFTASLFYPDIIGDFEINDKVKFRATFKSPIDYKNPASFSYKTWLASNNISFTGSITKEWISKIQSEDRFYNRLRDKIIKAIDTNTDKNNRAGSFLKALTVGEKDKSSKDVFSYFRNTGTVHILAISGLHVGFIVLFAFFVAHMIGYINPNLYNLIPKQFLSIWLSIPLIWIYIFIAGFPPSAMRAGIMMTAGLVVLSGGFIAHNLSLLMITAMILSAIFPLIIFNISFQLSMMAVLGIILIVPRFDFNSHNKFIKYIEGIILVSITALLFTAPLIAYYFHEISLMGILANIIVIPYTGLVIFPLAFISMILSIFSLSLGVVLFNFASFLTFPLTYFIEKLSLVSKNYLINFSPTIIEILAFYTILFTAIFWKKLHKIKFVLILIPILIFGINIVKYNTYKFEAVFFDVGQGDSTLITFSNGDRVLIDAGGTRSEDFDIGERVLAPALWNLGIRKIDEIIVTHPHRDHYKGMGYIAERFSPNTLWTNGFDAPQNEQEEWKEFIKRIENSNVDIKTANSNTHPLIFGEGSIEFIYPDEKPVDTINLNNTSLVIVARENNKCIMITGDIESIAEDYILKMYDVLQCDVLKIAHHGSSTSSTLKFLKAVNPQIAVISVGKQNPYNMPSDTVLNRLNAMNIETKRTDIDGMIRIAP